MSGRSDYQERRARRIERLRERAARARAEGTSRIAAAERIADVIPLGQPILVGHHSERRHRRDVARIHDGFSRGFESLEHAKELDRRAAAAEDGRAISSDDPDAVERLREKLAEVNAARDLGKRANAAHAVGGWDAVAQLDQGLATKLEREMRFHSDPFPFPSFRLRNLSAESRRLKKRIQKLEAKASRPAAPPEHYGDITIDEDDNRTRIRFPAKPADELRSELRAAGFRFAPSIGCWVRMASTAALYAARRIVGRYSDAPNAPCAYCGCTEPRIENEGGWPSCPQCHGV